MEDIVGASRIYSLLNIMRRLLLEISQQEEVLALVQEIRVKDYDELKER